MLDNYLKSIVPDPEVSDEESAQEGAAEVEAEAEVAQAAVELDDAELWVDGNRAPRGWIIDRFPGGRTVSALPWSRRPPPLLPEEWLLFKKSY